MSTPKKLWEPTEETKSQSNLRHYMEWLKSHGTTTAESYEELYEWSVNNIDEFWLSLRSYFKIIEHGTVQEVRSEDPMPKTRWFEGSMVNYSEHIFQQASDDRPAVVYQSEIHELSEISWKNFREKVASAAHLLRSCGVSMGDRVVAFLPNIPEAMIGFYAANSLGAVWSSTSPDFGTSSVIDRFAQIEPRVLIATNGYVYNGKKFNKLSVVQEIFTAIPSLEKLILVDYLGDDSADLDLPAEKVIHWNSMETVAADTLTFQPVPFSHPIWVLYSSGTTGKPKAITHSHGGVLLEHLKYLAFHNDVKPGDRCFWFTTTGWMMWNYIQASLLVGGTVVLFEGSPAIHNMDILWELIEQAGINHFGISAGFVVANMKHHMSPSQNHDLSSLRSIGSTGSPLPPEAFDWIYQEVNPSVWLTSISGGTDVCSAFVGGNPLWPVYAGEIQCRALGCDLKALNERGEEVFDEVGEMVIEQAMPSMPVFFWNDDNFARYTSSYFEEYPGKWRHGDWIRMTPRMGIVIYGRSDSTLNRGGVRIGTSEVYSAVDKVPEVSDSLIVCLENKDGSFYMPLFVVLSEGNLLDDQLKRRINSTIRKEYSPRHVPDEILEIGDIPYTISGKKVETPVKKILMGQDPETVINKDALRNPGALQLFKEFIKP